MKILWHSQWNSQQDEQSADLCLLYIRQDIEIKSSRNEAWGTKSIHELMNLADSSQKKKYKWPISVPKTSGKQKIKLHWALSMKPIHGSFRGPVERTKGRLVLCPFPRADLARSGQDCGQGLERFKVSVLGNLTFPPWRDWNYQSQGLAALSLCDHWPLVHGGRGSRSGNRVL